MARAQGVSKVAPLPRKSTLSITAALLAPLKTHLIGRISFVSLPLSLDRATKHANTLYEEFFVKGWIVLHKLLHVCLGGIATIKASPLLVTKSVQLLVTAFADLRRRKACVLRNCTLRQRFTAALTDRYRLNIA